MTMKKLLLTLLIGGGALVHTSYAVGQERLPEYLQAEKFTKEKLKTMLFSTMVDPHWSSDGKIFWYEYKTSEGTFWYVVNPSARSKELLFDRDELAAQLSEVVRDPFEARQLPLRNLKLKDDGRTFTFEVVSSREVKPEKGQKEKKEKTEVFYFVYDFPSRKLTHLDDGKKEPERMDWASVSPDGQTVVYAKDCNLFRMSMADYRKAQKDEKDSTIVEVQLTDDGTPDFGYGIPYSMLNTDTLCNGKRRWVYGCWSPDSRHFVTIVSDDRSVKPLWVINALADPRPTLETYKYQMPGEMTAPEEHLYLFDMTANTRREIRTAAWKNQSLALEYRPQEQKERDREWNSPVWQGDNNRFFLTRSSRDLHRIDLCTYTLGQDSVVPVVRERMNTYQETRPVHVFGGGKEFIQWSERDGWAHLYLYDDKGNLKNRITKGPWHVERVVKVDEASRTVYFIANGLEKGEHPYHEQLYRVNADGSGLKRLTEGDFFHQPEMDDDARYGCPADQSFPCLPL